MPVTPAQFKAKYTRWGSLADETVQAWLDDAYIEYPNESYFGDKYNRAIMLFTAHLLDVEDMAAEGRTGGLTSMSKGGESYGFANNSGKDLESTVYGQQFQKIVNSCYLGGFSTTTKGQY